MTVIKKKAIVGAMAQGAEKRTCLFSTTTTLIKSKSHKKSSIKSSPKIIFAEDCIPTFGGCYEGLINQYCLDKDLDFQCEQKMLKVAREVLLELHDSQLHEIMANNVDECINSPLADKISKTLVANTFNAVISTALKRGIIEKVQEVFFENFSLVVVDFFHCSLGENLECSGFKKQVAGYTSSIRLTAEACLKRIYFNLKVLKTEYHYHVVESLVAVIAKDLVEFMYECGLYKFPYSHKERKALVGALVIDVLMMARPKLDVCYVGNIIAGLNLTEEKRLVCEEVHG